VFSLVAAKGLHLSFDSGIPQQTGLLGGIFAGLLGAYANHTTTLTLDCKNKNEKNQRILQINKLLSEKGYQLQEEMEEVSVYARSALAKYLSGKVYVQVEAQQITIAGRASQIRGLRKQLT
jgi:hypothetical protein